LRWIEDHKSYDGDGCLIWPFSRDAKTGYAQPIVTYEGLKRPHVLMCESVNGPMPSKGFDVAHSCGGGKMGCVHPKHLRWATAKENAEDKNVHGTQIRGSSCYNAVLTENDIPKIRALKGSMSQREIGEIYGVSRSAIKNIFNGMTWSHVP
jgi:hypothetical protein